MLLLLIKNKQNLIMELFLDKNGNFLQRRKMYIGFPSHNMNSHMNFDWQGDDLSIQDKQGKKFKLRLEKDQIRKKYDQTLQKKYHSKYVDHIEQDVYWDIKNQPLNQKQKDQKDILSREIQHFDSSKLNRKIENPQNNLQKDTIRLEDKYPLSSSQLVERQQEQRYDNSRYEPYNQQASNITRRQNIDRYNYQPQNKASNYYTLSPAIVNDRNRSYQLPKSSFNNEFAASPSKFVEKMYTGSAPINYQFRNFKPDNLEDHLRNKTKADHKRAVKVSLNLFDYTKH